MTEPAAHDWTAIREAMERIAKEKAEALNRPATLL